MTFPSCNNHDLFADRSMHAPSEIEHGVPPAWAGGAAGFGVVGFGLGVVGFGVVGVVVGAVVVVVVVVGAAVDVGESIVGILGELAADAPPPHAAVRMAVP